ncbi:uncharacterized protein LOC123561855 isoform X2 [Mercenaria mercenaria]|uniref:uncharacterized protein LOC123561855 isoform X2 n=2 Tax=Mercenaria mercenaria TaxID=6596 RepID=UPI00234F481B|nr:uncharacterized protein LOC123561855 isoform X2 [Mercenaria mercenaria]
MWRMKEWVVCNRLGISIKTRSATCGSLEFEQDTVTQGGVATLIYKPLNIYASRKWYKEQSSLTLLYDSGKSITNIKYVEAAQGGVFALSIMGVGLADTGLYIVSCGQLYTERSRLTVTPAPTVASCGSLEFEQDTVTEGGVAKLIYKPHDIGAPRQWYKEERSLTLLYDSGKSNTYIKYVEATQEGAFALSIKGVIQADAGFYIVSCGQLYTERTRLTVTPPPTGESQTNCGSLTVKTNNLTEGQAATLQFSIHLGRPVKWEKKINSTFQQLYKGKHYDITKNGEKTIHNLWIYSSDFSDSGEYRVNCDSAVSNSVHLYIVPKAPTVPEFSGNGSIPECKECILAELNVSVNVECFVKGGTEPVVLNMFKDGKIISNVNKSITSKDGVNIYHARHKYLPNTMDCGVVFTCNVKNPALRAESNKSAPLYIRADPETVKVKVKQATENEQSEIQCIAKKGRPPRKSLIFIENVEEDKTEKISEIKTDHTYSVTTTVVKNFTRFDNQKKVVCCSNILSSICSNTSNVNVLFPPKKVRVIEIMKRNEDNGDTELKLRCSVDVSNPRSSIEWKGVKNVPRNLTVKKYTNHSDTNGWTYSADWVFNLTKDDNGRSIRCEVKNPQFPNLELVQLFRPNITYAPIITVSGQENGVAYLGDDVFISCHVDSNPPSMLSWYNQTDLIKELYGAKDFDLHLVNVSFDHSQIYTCTAHNSIGSTKSKYVTLIVKDASEKPVTKPMASKESSSSSVAGPVIGCAIALVVAVVAVTAFLYWRKKRQNTSLERKGTYQIEIEDRKPSVHLVDNEPVYNNVAASSNEDAVEEQPEYAFVVPKNERENANACPEPVNDAENESPQNEKGDNLVYAELDLNQDSNNAVKRPLVIRDEPTEYVSIDFHKTGAVTMNEDGGEI